MKLFIKKNILLVLIFLALSVPVSISAQLRAYNYTEAGLALARAPLASFSQRYHNDHSKTAKLIHCSTDLTRIAAEVLNILNHPTDGFLTSSFFWSFFDAANLGLDLIAQDQLTANIIDDNDQDKNNNSLTKNTEMTRKLVGQRPQKQYETLNQMIEAMQEYILPFAESTSAFMLALNIDQTPEARLERQRLRALCSLSRALAVYANHKKSIPAIALLIGAITEMTLAVQSYPPVQHQPHNRGQGHQVPPQIPVQEQIQEPQQVQQQRPEQYIQGMFAREQDIRILNAQLRNAPQEEQRNLRLRIEQLQEQNAQVPEEARRMYEAINS